MGISGLLPTLKPLIKPSNIRSFHHKRVAVDTYSWIHKALYGSLDDYIPNSDSNSFKWVHYCLKYLDMLLHYDMEVYLVFDGANLPAKAKTEQLRAESRQKNYELSQQLLCNGDKTQGRNLLARSVDVTPRMAAQFIKICREYRPTVKCIVAPYEADAQLAYLSRNNLVDIVLTEDSDCIPYLCREIIFKLDQKTGDCEYFKFDEINQTAIDGFDLLSFTPDMITSMCILSGCDYLASPVGYGMKKSHKLVSKQKTPHKLLRSLKFEGSIPLTSVSLHPVNSSHDVEPIRILSYEYGFYLALMTFHHQTVFDVVNRQCCPLTPVPGVSTIFPAYMLTHLPADELSQTSPTYFLGYIISDDSLARGIADGLVDPVSKTPFNLPDHMDHILMRTQSNPSLSTSCQSHSSFKAVNKSIENPATPVAQQSKSIQETSSNGRHVTPIRKGKNLKDFFTPLSRHEKENSRNVMKSDISVLHRSNTCPSISSKKTQPFTHFTSPFQSHDKKKKLSFMESFVQSKKQKKFSPALSTKESLQLLSERTIAIARENLRINSEKVESFEAETLVKQCDVIILSDSEGETELPDEKLSSSQNQSPIPDLYAYSLSPPVTPTGEDMLAGLSSSPLSTSPLPSEPHVPALEVSTSTPHRVSPSTNELNQEVFTTSTSSSSALHIMPESDVIDDSDHNMTPPRVTSSASRPKYSSLLIEGDSRPITIDKIKHFSSRKKRMIPNQSASSSSSPSIPSQPSPVGVDSFLKFQYICN